jgi:hypothetical protein
MDFHTSALILAWAAILVLAFAMAGLLRQVRALSAGSATPLPLGPPIGSVAPSLHSSGQTDWQGTTVALFLDESCQSCDRALRLAEDLAATNGERIRLVAVFPTGMNGHRPRRVEVVEDAGEAFARFRVPMTPYGVVIGGDGRIEHAAPLGAEQGLAELVERTLGGR